jgi:hypothetical protein
MIIKGETFACETCIRGHRAAKCQHTGQFAPRLRYSSLLKLTVNFRPRTSAHPQQRQTRLAMRALPHAPAVALRAHAVQVRNGRAYESRAGDVLLLRGQAVHLRVAEYRQGSEVFGVPCDAVADPAEARGQCFCVSGCESDVLGGAAVEYGDGD